jgi:hypothetical protein
VLLDGREPDADNLLLDGAAKCCARQLVSGTTGWLRELAVAARRERT